MNTTFTANESSRRRIEPLSTDAISRIKSSGQIVTLRGAVLALIENSLDAGATKINADVCFRRGDCTVDDNGHGIALREFRPEGGLCKMYHTSKRMTTSKGPQQVHSDTGTFLASLSALSTLHIVSRQDLHHEGGALSMRCGSILSRSLCHREDEEPRFGASCGTSVKVRDLFGNMPVRVKQRALAAEIAAPGAGEWQKLKHGILALLLAWPRPCTVKLCEAAADGKSIRLGFSCAQRSLTKRNLDGLQGKPPEFRLEDALRMLYQANISPPETRYRWVPIEVSSATARVKGSICLEPVPTRQAQFISFGVQPCDPDAHGNLYEILNQVFRNSGFGVTESPSDIVGSTGDQPKGQKRNKSSEHAQRQPQRKKGTDRWPMFVLRIHLLNGSVSGISHAADKSGSVLREIADMLEAMAQQWLAAHNLRPLMRHHRGKDCTKPSTQRVDFTFPASKVTSRLQAPRTPKQAIRDLERTAEEGECAESTKRPRLLDRQGSLRDRDVQAHVVLSREDRDALSALSHIKSATGTLQSGVMVYKKPSTAPSRLSDPAIPRLPSTNKAALPSAALEFDAMTESAISAQSPSKIRLQTHTNGGDRSMEESSDYWGSIDDQDLIEMLEHGEVRTSANTRHTAPAYTAKTDFRRPVRLPRSFEQNNKCSPNHAEALPRFLREWQNPVFERQEEECIPCVVQQDLTSNDALTLRAAATATGFLDLAHNNETVKLTRLGLKKARVIEQVDGKVILCKMMATSPRHNRIDTEVLVVVDQHAASERVLLEGLLRELCTSVGADSPLIAYSTNTGCKSEIDTCLLDNAIRTQVSEFEWDLFRKRARHFARWGILYDLVSIRNEANASQVRLQAKEHHVAVRTLPYGIAERCRMSTNLLTDLLRSEIWSLEDDNGGRHATRADLNGDHRDEEDEHGNNSAWVRRIGSCPKGIIDLLNSRSCRSAIMFNDPLSKEQCQQLLDDLSTCVFPFVCAHGRSSMVPLVRLGSCDNEGGVNASTASLTDTQGPRGYDAFTSAFKTWRDACVDQEQDSG